MILEFMNAIKIRKDFKYKKYIKKIKQEKNKGEY